MILNLPKQEQVDQIAGSLAPDVVRIRMREGLDWSDHDALYFYVILSDEASRVPRLHQIANEVRQKIDQELGLGSRNFLAYPRFRSETEQRELKEPLWD